MANKIGLDKGRYWDECLGAVVGCGFGCVNCWARAWAGRFGKSFTPTMHSEALDKPLKRKQPTVYFVALMGDLFDPAVTDEFIGECYDAMESAKHHVFIVCTKRSGRIVPALYCPPNVRFGEGDALENVIHLTSISNQADADRRVPELLKLREHSPGWPCLGVSVEPMLGAIDLSQWLGKGKLDWVICGGENGTGARPMMYEWAEKIRDQCANAYIPFFFKGHGSASVMLKRTLCGQEHNGLPPLMQNLLDKRP